MSPYSYVRAAKKNLGIRLDVDQDRELARLFKVAMQEAQDQRDRDLKKIRDLARPKRERRAA